MGGRLTPFIELFRELRRRRVIHVALVYLTGAVVVGLDAFNNAMDVYGLPVVLQQAFGVLVVLGFPVAVLAAWWLEWTDEGIRRVEAEPPSPVVRRLAGASAVVLVAGAGAIGGVLAIRSPTPAIPAGPTDEGRPPVTSRQATVLGILPVEHAGRDEAGSWVGAALAAHLEDALADVPAFAVVHRRSLETYRARGTPLDSLADLLDIDYFISAQVTDAPGGGAAVLVELVNGPTNEVLAGDQIRVTTRSPEAVLDTLILRIEEVLRPALGQQVRLRQWHADTRDTVAIRLRYQAEERIDLARRLARVDASAADREYAIADSLLAAASDRDPDWTDPLVARARLADRWALSRIGSGTGPSAAALWDHGIEQAETVLERDPDNAEALAWRGHLRWRKAVIAGLRGSEEGARLVDQAEADLRAALEQDPRQVVAAASLSEIQFRERQRFADARQYAEQAYRQDAYLDRVGEIINRIALSAFELGDDEEALEWSRHGLRRQSNLPMHAAAILDIMAWGDIAPDPAEAWEHMEAVAEVDPQSRTYYGYAMAAVLARSGLADSARAVLNRHTRSLSRASRESNLGLEAAVLFRLGDIGEAERLLRRYREIAPAAARGLASSRKLRGFVEPSEPTGSP